jgi:excisionase family DNA binding protein
MPSRHKRGDGDDYLSTAEAARIAGVSVRTIDRYVAAERLACMRLPSGHRRYRRDDVERLLSDTESVSA